ncbi:MAG: flagellar basal body L-ring protein FlgH [Steroidobacteraceae bacterium]|jgi:flagellar L-ring protein precursor FlgH|nr:flagellar basal body L-ring protein FlgH [Steroidobacteraceae bacterium]
MRPLIARLAAVLPRLALAAALAATAGCAGFGAEHGPAEPEMPELAAAPPSGNGAIYQAGYEAPLFENPTARRAGDILTIRLVENTNASKSSSTSTSKATAVTLPGPTIGGRPVTVNGTAILSGGVENEASFDGEGSSRQSNRLNGDLTVTVVRRLPNGTLLVRGEKWITINQGRELVRVSGLVRQIDVEPDNTVPSSKVANASITYVGKGALADASAPSWLARFFMSPKLPF